MTAKSINDVLASHNDSLLSLPGVVGTAIGLCDSTPCIHVYLADSNEINRGRIPTDLEGYRVHVEVTGTFRPRRPGG